MGVILYCDSPEALRTNVCSQGCVPSDYWGAHNIVPSDCQYWFVLSANEGNPVRLKNSKVNLEIGQLNI